MVKQKNEFRSRKLLKQIVVILSIIMTIAFAFIGIMVFALTNPSIRCFGTPFPSKQNFEKFTYMEFPDSASNLMYSILVNGDFLETDCTMWLSFEITPEDIEILQVSTHIENFEHIQLEGGQFDYYMEFGNWTQPDDSIAGTYSSWDIGIVQWSFIDISNPDKWIVYVITYDYWS